MRKLITILAVLFVVSAGGIAFYVLSLPPKEAFTKNFKEEAVAKIVGRRAQLDEVKEKTGNVSYDGKNISFQYPAKAVIYDLKDPGFASSSSLLEDFSFDIRQPRIVLNLAVLANTAHLRSIDDYPGVTFRKNSPGQYKATNMKMGAYTGRVFEREDLSPEKTAFFLINEKIYTISVTGTVFEEVKKVADLILGTARFK